jgi:hypothetical protein
VSTRTASGPARTGGWFRWQNWPSPARAARSPLPVTSLPGWPGPAGPSRASAGSPAATPPLRETPWPPAAGPAWPPTPRVRSLAGSLIAWQWPDGGWNCDPAATGRRSSFRESLAPAWGLHEYWQATGDLAARDAASRTAGLFLAHRLFRSLTTGQVIHRAWLAPHYPPCWHYGILQVLLVLSRMGRAGDPRASDALGELERRRLPGGRWQAEYRTSAFLRASAQAAAAGQRGRRSTGAKEVPLNAGGLAEQSAKPGTAIAA